MNHTKLKMIPFKKRKIRRILANQASNHRCNREGTLWIYYKDYYERWERHLVPSVWKRGKCLCRIDGLYPLMIYASMLVEIEQDAEIGAFKMDFTLYNLFTEIYRN